jgi:pimeloyl-ACP methyl ester carboxylesterase
VRSLFLLAVVILSANAIAAEDCRVGTYRLPSREHIVITRSAEDTLRYRLFDGRSGRLYPKNATELYSGPGWAAQEPVIATAKFTACTQLEFHLKDGPSGIARRVLLPKQEAHFMSGGVDLYGELYRPLVGKPRALVVLIFGSGSDSATAYNYLQHMLPLHGIATFVYDKRGTGPSGGKLSANFDVLADDAVAALAKAREMLNQANIPAGFIGESQGGWIAPLAATRTRTDFVVVSYGLAVSPLEESREQIADTMREKGHGEDAVAKALQLTDLTARIITSRFQEGLDELQHLKTKYASEPWLRDVQGDFTGLFLQADDSQLAALRTAFDIDLSMHYEPKPVLGTVAVPMLWVLGGKDIEAPSATTLAVLKALQPRSRQLDIAVFPNADHGIMEFETVNGERRYTRESAGYHELLAHWVLSRDLRGKFGSAELLRDSD